jgi:hypothetical protein
MKDMETRIAKFLRSSGLFSVLPLSLCLLTVPAAAQRTPTRLGEPVLRDPIWVYNDWSAYDELSDNIPLTDALAMKELDQIVRLKKLGVHFDYYMMDAFWFAPDGGYRTWRTPNWPHGPDRWIAQCKANGLLPGM